MTVGVGDVKGNSFPSYRSPGVLLHTWLAEPRALVWLSKEYSWPRPRLGGRQWALRKVLKKSEGSCPQRAWDPLGKLPAYTEPQAAGKLCFRGDLRELRAE